MANKARLVEEAVELMENYIGDIIRAKVEQKNLEWWADATVIESRNLLISALFHIVKD